MRSPVMTGPTHCLKGKGGFHCLMQPQLICACFVGLCAVEWIEGRQIDVGRLA